MATDFGFTEDSAARIGRTVRDHERTGPPGNQPPSKGPPGTIPALGPFWCTITAHSSTNATNWSPYTATSDDGVSRSIYNNFETNGTSDTIIQGSPGSLGVNVDSSAVVNSGACHVMPIGNGARVLVVWDAKNARLGFCAANSAQ